MLIHERMGEFAGLPVADFTENGMERNGEPLTAPPTGVAWRVRVDDEDEAVFGDVLGRFLETVDPATVTALVVGWWGYESPVGEPVTSLVGAADRLTALRSLFVGDVVVEEREISWIEQSDITPLPAAFPRLERLGVRGGEGSGQEPLRLRPFRSAHLRELRFESGGLPADVVRAVAASELPALEHLEMWLGMEHYGGDATVADLAPILTGERLPSLRHLGLQDSEIQDAIAEAVAQAPVVARLETLALSMGTLTDTGAEALLSGQPLIHLRSLDLHHHYLSDAMAARVRAALPGVKVDLSGALDPEHDTLWVAVSE
ncbi:MAG TPA: STM4015 family protein [Thermomonospora sp.]|nr:STM4015 family protein [Thermomonospora sp.]